MIYGTLSKVDPDNKGPRDKPAGWDWREREIERKKKKKESWTIGNLLLEPASKVNSIQFWQPCWWNVTRYEFIIIVVIVVVEGRKYIHV